MIITVGSQASVAVAFPVLDTSVFAGQSNVTSIGQVIAGGTLSMTTIVLLQVAVLPQSSVAVHVLVAVYDPVQLPGVELSENVMATVPSHASVAVGATHVGVSGQLIGVV